MHNENTHAPIRDDSELRPSLRPGDLCRTDGIADLWGEHGTGMMKRWQGSLSDGGLVLVVCSLLDGNAYVVAGDPLAPRLGFVRRSRLVLL
jgi:hypothetical protein